MFVCLVVQLLDSRRATEMMIETPWSVFQSFRALMVNVFQDGTDQLHLWGTEAMLESGCFLGCAGLDSRRAEGCKASN